MNLHHIPPVSIQQTWPLVEKYLADGLKYSAGEYNVDQLKVMVVRGEHALFAFTDENGDISGAGTICFENYPNERVAFVSCVGGRALSTPKVFEQLKTWCVNHGATSIRGAGRDSIVRLWQMKFNFKKRYTIVEYKL